MNLLRLFALSILATVTALGQQITLPLWSHGAPEPTTLRGPERDATLATDKLIAGRRIIKLTNVTEPALTVYKSGAANSPAVLVFPGGGYQLLAYDLEGTEVCDWLNSIHVTACW